MSVEISSDSEIEDIKYRYVNDEERYKIYENGNIFDTVKDKFLNKCYDKKGKHYVVTLVVNEKKSNYALHRVMFTTFYPEVIIEDGFILGFKEYYSNTNLDNIELRRRFNPTRKSFDPNVWSPIKGEEEYLINRNGEIKSAFGTRLKALSKLHECRKVIFTKRGKHTAYYIDNLVYSTFVEPIGNNVTLEHIDGDLKNNNVENLKRKITIKGQQTVPFRYLNDSKTHKVYENGIVYGMISRRILKPKERNLAEVILKIEGKRVIKFIHYMVYELFVGPVPIDQRVIHKDGDRNNNKLSNLILEPIEVQFDENWRRIPGFKNYIASNKGEIKSLITGKVLICNVDKNNIDVYVSFVVQNDDGEWVPKSCHSLVHLAFHGMLPENFVIDHLNQVKLDNRPENLKAVTKSENSKNWTRPKYTRSTEEILCPNFVNIGAKIKGQNLFDYSINKFGQIKNSKGMLMKKKSNGYYFGYSLRDSITKIDYTHSCHQLVASIFIPNPNDYPVVHHLDKNGRNNYVDNLMWTTQQLNVIYSKGKRVCQYTLQGEFIREYNCFKEAARAIGNVTYAGGISDVCNGKYKTSHGYIWKYP